MTRINSAIAPKHLTDEHLLAEHREIKRLPNYFRNRSKILGKIPDQFCLGPGHVTFFLDKGQFTLDRYKTIHRECLDRGFTVEDYSDSWQQVPQEYMNEYSPGELDRKLLLERISSKINLSKKPYFRYRHKNITKERAIQILCT